MNAVLVALTLSVALSGVKAHAAGLEDMTSEQAAKLSTPTLEATYLVSIGKTKAEDCIRNPDMYKEDKNAKKLSLAELCALVEYTDEAYSLNAKLGEPEKPENKLNGKEYAFALLLDRALAKIESAPKVTVYSGTSARHFADLEEGKPFKLKTFLSTSPNKYNAEGFAKDAMLVLRTRSGKDVRNFSAWEMEDELTIPRGTEFKVEKIETRQVKFLMSEDPNELKTVKYIILREIVK